MKHDGLYLSSVDDKTCIWSRMEWLMYTELDTGLDFRSLHKPVLILLERFWFSRAHGYHHRLDVTWHPLSITSNTRRGGAGWGRKRSQTMMWGQHWLASPQELRSIHVPSELSLNGPKRLSLSAPTVTSHWPWAVSENVGMRLLSAAANLAGLTAGPTADWHCSWVFFLEETSKQSMWCPPHSTICATLFHSVCMLEEPLPHDCGRPHSQGSLWGGSFSRKDASPAAECWPEPRADTHHLPSPLSIPGNLSNCFCWSWLLTQHSDSQLHPWRIHALNHCVFPDKVFCPIH